MLRTAQYAWQQAALSENARAVFDVGRQLHDRLAAMGRHMDRLGKALSNAVVTYNQTVGSLESKVLVSARRLSQLGLVDAGLEAPGLVEDTARALSAPELTAEVAAKSGTGPGTPGPGTSPDPGELTRARYRNETG
jgi:DNA recombination protein RmuC